MNPSVRALLWSAWPRRISPCAAPILDVRTRNRGSGIAEAPVGAEKRALPFEEGMIFEGEVGAFGFPGDLTRWITVAPFDKSELHSISDPYDLHCMPVVIASRAISEGRLTHVATDPYHPIVRLQRVKEFLDVRDTHLGAAGGNIEKMLELLGDAVRFGENYAPYAAGEILAMLKKTPSGFSDTQGVAQRVRALMKDFNNEILTVVRSAPAPDIVASQ